MKKVIVMFLLMGVVVTSYADIAKSVLLHHNGQVTMYDYDAVQTAVDNAVDGDTIYLAEGTFAPFNIDKRIMVRGSGSATIVEGNCTINISGTEKLHMPVIDALCFNGTITVASAYRQFTMRKVRCNALFFTGSEHHDAKMDRCYVTNTFQLTTNVREFNALGSKICSLNPHDHVTGQLTFNHCNIYEVTDTITAVFRNTIIYRSCKVSSTYSTFNFFGCVFDNCALNYNYVNTTNTVTNRQSGSLSSNCEYSGTIGISSEDGTKIGAYGGQYPFTQSLELPKVTNHTIVVDGVNRKLNVTLTIDQE